MNRSRIYGAQSLGLDGANIEPNLPRNGLVICKRFYSLFVGIAILMCCSNLMKVNGGIIPASLDTQILNSLDWNTDPCNDFYQFTCGNWAIQNPLSKHSIRWSVSSIGTLSTIRSIRKYFEDFRENAQVPKIVQQSHIMYKSCMDSGNQKEKTRNMIENYLDKLSLPNWPSLHDEYNGFGNSFDFIGTIANVQRVLGVNIVFEFMILNDHGQRIVMMKKLGNQLMSIQTGTLTKQVKDCIMFLNPKANETEVLELTNAIIRLEQKFAQIEKDSFKKSRNGTQKNDYIKLRVENNLKRYTNLTFEETDGLRLGMDLHSAFYLDSVLEIGKPDLALFVWWKLIYDFIGSIEFDATGERLSLFCAAYMVEVMGMHLGFAIEQPDFQTTTKPKVLEMLEDIRSILSEQVNESTWIGNNTKRLLIQRIQGMNHRMGIPEHFLNDTLYEGDGELGFSTDSVLENSIKMRQWILNRILKKNSERDDWIAAPTVVNAFYNPYDNSINIPIATLKFWPYFFDTGIDVLEYATLGLILSHEIAHGLAGELGPSYDGDIEQKEYEVRSQCFVDQYDNFKVPETNFKTNGTITLDENLADNVGIRSAFQAYKKHVSKYGEKEIPPQYNRFTHDQLFFLGFAHQWCSSYSTFGLEMFEYYVHSPYMQRVNNVVANSEEFKNAFKCRQKPEDLPKKSCTFF